MAADEIKDTRPEFEHVAEQPSDDKDISAVYHVACRREVRKWQVRFAESEHPIKLFDSREEAVAYAKGLAAARHATVRAKR